MSRAGILKMGASSSTVNEGPRGLLLVLPELHTYLRYYVEH